MSVAIDYTGGAFAANKAQGVGTITGSDIDVSSGNYFAYTPTANTTFTFSNAPVSGTAAGFALAVTGAYGWTDPDLTSASYDSVSFSVATQETSPTGIQFKPDGTKMFITGFTDRVFEYMMSTAWDLSTLSFVDYFSAASQSSNASDVFFSADGTKFYVEDQTTATIYQYSMTAAWDVSTASYDSKSFSVSSQETGPLGVHFKPDGTKMYVIGYSDDTVVQYSLSTAWDVSTASYDSKESPSVVSVTGNPTDVIFNPDGTKMWVTGVSDVVAEYGLSTAWDVSTATYSSISFDVSGQTDSPRGITFKPDGSKMYLVELTNDAVYQYSTGTSSLVTFTYPSSVSWAGGTAPDAPAVGETDVLVFYTDDGGTNWYGFQAGGAMA